MWDNKEDELSRLNLRYLLLGIIQQLVASWVHDRDYWRLRTNYWRRLYTFVGGVLLFLKFLDSLTGVERESLSLGIAVGGALYRLWYGVLYPLPNSIK